MASCLLSSSGHLRLRASVEKREETLRVSICCFQELTIQSTALLFLVLRSQVSQSHCFPESSQSTALLLSADNMAGKLEE
jgi:hypothetical protein